MRLSATQFELSNNTCRPRPARSRAQLGGVRSRHRRNAKPAPKRELQGLRKMLLPFRKASKNLPLPHRGEWMRTLLSFRSAPLFKRAGVFKRAGAFRNRR
jgi:hypothetical protein